MEKRTYQQLWQALNAADKRKLSQRVDSTYDNLKCVASRKGKCGKRLARDITLELIDMGVVEGDLEVLLPVIFPQFVMSTVPTSAGQVSS